MPDDPLAENPTKRVARSLPESPQVSLVYKGTPLSGVLKLDLLVENSVVVEVKAVERYHPVHLAQLVTYLKLTGHPAGLLMNFNVTSLKYGLRRADHPDRYVRKTNS
jgi:GxxExxY protein